MNKINPADLPLASFTIDPSAAALPAATIKSFDVANASMALTYSENYYLQRPHMANSITCIAATAIEAAARAPQDAPKRALILGLGNGNDTPIAEIVDAYDETTVVDISMPHPTNRLAQLTTQQLAKVNLVQADMSGAAKSYDDAIEKAKEHNGRADFVEAVTGGLQGIDFDALTPPDLGSGFTFVSSQLVMTQLGALPGLRIQKELHERFRQAIRSDADPGSPDGQLAQTINACSQKLHTRHMDQLAHLVSDSGLVHFADTFGAARNGRVEQTVPLSVVRKMGELFWLTRRPEDWMWNVRPGFSFWVYCASLLRR